MTTSVLDLNGPVLFFGVLRRPRGDGRHHPRLARPTGGDPWIAGHQPNGDDIEIRLMILQYASGSAAKKMRDRGLPSGYADALETGLWPSCDVLSAEELACWGDAIAPAVLSWS